MLKKKMARLASAIAICALVVAMAVPMNAMASVVGSMRISGSTTVQPVCQALAQSFMRTNPNARITVVGGGSSVGVTDVLAGRVAVGMSARNLRPAERQAGAVGTVIARDALTVIVHPNNRVQRLTRAQVTGIYTGRITNWNQVGGANAPIVPVGRVAVSGTFEFFRESFLAGVTQSARVRSLESNGLVRQAVAGNPNAIGYVSMAFVNPTIRGVAIDGVAPTRANAMNGTYRFVRPLFLVTRGAPTGMARSFINFATSPAGQQIVARSYLPIR